MGHARLEKGGAAPKVIVKSDKGEESFTPKHVILATGARAREMPDLGMKADGKRLWTYREAMTPPEWPQSLLVFGSGAIGIEFASFYQALGVKVTVVELLDRILPVEDAEVSAFALKQFKKLGLEFRIGAKASNVVAGPNGVTATIDTNGQKETLSASHAIIAVGIVGNVENLGLEALGVKVDRTHIVTDGLGKTNVPGLYAIGDVTGPPWLAHKAGHEGTACIEAIAGGHAHALDVTKIPGCTYSHPQIASVGLTEARAKELGKAVRVGKFPFQGNGKAIALGEAEGFVKTIFDAKTGELLGAHMIGAEVTELIQGYAVAMSAEATEAELIGTVFPHPTLSEMMHEAVLDAYGRAINA
jgi:dihydrolipoamide dehydrogenase